jgi:hypothetical protein
MPDYLTKLNPMGTILAQDLDICLYDYTSYVYQVFLTGHLLPLNDSVIDNGGMCAGGFSPVNAITLDDHSRNVANIPEDAVYFAWAYPISGLELVSDDIKRELDPKYPEISFILFGGFIFFNEKYNLIQVNAVYGGKNINFSEPKFLPYSDVYYTYIKHGRMQENTIQEFKDRDITHVSWIAPYEKVGGNTIAPYGGFLYLYNDKTANYFEIVPAHSEQTIDPLLDNRTPFNMIQNCLKYIETEFEEELKGLTKDEIIVKITNKCKKFKEKVDELQDVFSCKQCMSNPQNIAFSCGHMLCNECADSIKGDCPMCRKPISTKLKLYYN